MYLKLGCMQEDQAQVLTQRAIELARILFNILSPIEVEVQFVSLLDSGPLSENVAVLRAPVFSSKYIFVAVAVFLFPQ